MNRQFFFEFKFCSILFLFLLLSDLISNEHLPNEPVSAELTANESTDLKILKELKVTEKGVIGDFKLMAETNHCDYNAGLLDKLCLEEAQGLVVDQIDSSKNLVLELELILAKSPGATFIPFYLTTGHSGISYQYYGINTSNLAKGQLIKHRIPLFGFRIKEGMLRMHWLPNIDFDSPIASRDSRYLLRRRIATRPKSYLPASLVNILQSNEFRFKDLIKLRAVRLIETQSKKVQEVSQLLQPLDHILKEDSWHPVNVLSLLNKYKIQIVVCSLLILIFGAYFNFALQTLFVILAPVLLCLLFYDFDTASYTLNQKVLVVKQTKDKLLTLMNQLESLIQLGFKDATDEMKDLQNKYIPYLPDIPKGQLYSTQVNQISELRKEFFFKEDKNFLFEFLKKENAKLKRYCDEEKVSLIYCRNYMDESSFDRIFKHYNNRRFKKVISGIMGSHNYVTTALGKDEYRLGYIVNFTNGTEFHSGSHIGVGSYKKQGWLSVFNSFLTNRLNNKYGWKDNQTKLRELFRDAGMNPETLDRFMNDEGVWKAKWQKMENQQPLRSYFWTSLKQKPGWIMNAEIYPEKKVSLLYKNLIRNQGDQLWLLRGRNDWPNLGSALLSKQLTHDLIQQVEPQSGFYLVQSGRKNYLVLNVAVRTHTDYRLFYVLNYDELCKTLLGNQKDTFYLIVIFSLFSLLVIAMISISKVILLNQLIQGFKAITAGNYRYRVQAGSKGGETYTLSHSLNNLLKSLQEKEVIFGFLSRQKKEVFGELQTRAKRQNASILFLGIEARETELDIAIQDLQNRIVQWNGWVDKFTGNAILGVFEMEDHAQDSVNCLLECIQETDFKLGIGIATGLPILGETGSSERKDYTVIGDTVNRAARLEAHALKSANSAGVIDSKTLDSITENEVRKRFSELSLKLKGIEESVKAYEYVYEEK